jgi:3-hydroxyacyl-CoA dehydrogenase
MHIEKVAVIGAGTMGAAIAACLIVHKFTVVLKDVNQEFIQTGIAKIDRFLATLVKRGLGESDAQAAKNLLSTSTDYTAFNNIDLVIEAVSENIDIKKIVFEELDAICPPHTILATNTSSLSITKIASFTKRPGKVVGLHFFNPAHIMKLVEVIAGLKTTNETIEAAIAFGKSLDKLAVRVEECPSFLVNRLLGRYMNESLWCLQEGIASVDEIDKAARDFAMPIGPLALRDMNGADIGLAVARFNYQEYGERFRVPQIIEEMVKENMLGQKTGSGFYLYDKETKKAIATNPEITSLLAKIKFIKTQKTAPFCPERLFLPMINEAFLALQEKICTVKDLDPALMAGLSMRKGPLALASEIGFDKCLAQIEQLFEIYGERFRPALLLKRYVASGENILV